MATFEYSNGRRANMEQRYAVLLEKLGKGKILPSSHAKAETRQLKAEDDKADKPKRAYKRRDMKAEE